jgi:hypothetical protein
VPPPLPVEVADAGLPAVGPGVSLAASFLGPDDDVAAL